MTRVRLAFLVLAVFAVARSANSEGPSDAEVAAVDATVAAVLQAIHAGDAVELKRLGSQSKPDPWLVCDALCLQKKRPEASRFARSAPRPDVARLPAFVDTWQAHAAERTVLASVLAAMKPGTWQRAADLALKPIQSAFLRVLVLEQRAKALGHLAGERKRDKQSEAIYLESEATYDTAAKTAEVLGWLRMASRLYSRGVHSALARLDYATSAQRLEKRYDVYLRRENARSAARAAILIGEIYGKKLLNYEGARTAFGRALVHATEYPLLQAQVRNELGHLASSTADYTQALTEFRAAKSILDNVQAPAQAGVALANIADVHRLMGHFTESKSAFDEALRMLSKAPQHHARVLVKKGTLYLAMGDVEEAMRLCFEDALKAQLARGHRFDAAATRGQIGAAYEAMGQYRAAMRELELASEEMQAIARYDGAADMDQKLGALFLRLGDYERSVERYASARNEALATNDGHTAAACLANIGNVHEAREESKDALEKYVAALSELQALPYPPEVSIAQVTGNIGVAYHSLGDNTKALEYHRTALEQKRKLKDHVGAFMTLANIGEVHQHMGDLDRALEMIEEGVDSLENKHAAADLLEALTMLARLHLERGEHRRACDTAHRGLREVAKVLEGLDDEHGSSARGQYDELFAVGALAAQRMGDSRRTYTFLESGRAGALREALGSRHLSRTTMEDLPPEVRAELVGAKAAKIQARQAFDLAMRSGVQATWQAASQALERARIRLRDASHRARQNFGGARTLPYSKPKSMREVQGLLHADQALVLYGVYFDKRKRIDEALAVVLRKDTARVVLLGKTTDIESTCARVADWDADGISRGMNIPKGVEPPKPPSKVELMASVRKLVIEPLQLGDDVKRVLISPQGILCYLPFGALFELDRTVTMTPSGSTQSWLTERSAIGSRATRRGAGILALGDPLYIADPTKGIQAQRYNDKIPSRLIQSGVEAQAVSANALLREHASEEKFRAALSTSIHWRAIHFACHGFVNDNAPMLSCLALSKTGDDEASDGLLTASEIFDLAMPTDLAVLSACDTSIGRHLKSEGVMALSRAFLIAGAPRVICSLWEVPDAATSALMKKFYELWNPTDASVGVSASEALKRAQRYVRSQQGWEAPTYWAAWVLWGLPD